MAHVETQPGITAFRAIFRHVPPESILNKVPEELVSMIGDQVRQMAFEDEIEKWVRLEICLREECGSVSHLSYAELCPPGYDNFTEAYESKMALIARERHAKDVEDFRESLMNLEGDSAFAKRVQCFSKYSPIIPLFCIEEPPHDGPGGFKDTYAYIIIYDPFEQRLSWAPSSGQHPSDARIQEFHAAATMLKLHPYDEHEEEQLSDQIYNHDLDIDKVFGTRISGNVEDSNERGTGTMSDRELDYVPDTNGPEDTSKIKPLVLSLPHRDGKNWKFQPEFGVLGVEDVAAFGGLQAHFWKTHGCA